MSSWCLGNEILSSILSHKYFTPDAQKFKKHSEKINTSGIQLK